MKGFFKVFGAAAIVTTVAVGAMNAQDAPAADPCKDVDAANAKYQIVLDNYRSTDVAKLNEAQNAAKEYLEKWGNCTADFEAQITWVKGQKFEEKIKRAKDMELAKQLDPLFARYDKAIATDNADELYAAGKGILALVPNDINILYPMAVIGPREVAKNNMKYNAEVVATAKRLLDYLKGGGELTKLNKGVKTNTIGALKHEKNREEAISELTYTLGYVNFYGLKNMKAGIPYYYEVTQLPGFFKTYPAVYATIGDYYVAERAPIGKEIADLIVKQKAATTDEEKLKLDEQIKAKVGLFNGYTERALDAYGRAWTVAKSDTPALKTYKDNLLTVIKENYKLMTEKDAGAEQWVATAVAKPLPDPMSAVQPVLVEEPAASSPSATPNGGSVANKPIK